jgi:hypothetical protein
MHAPVVVNSSPAAARDLTAICEMIRKQAALEIASPMPIFQQPR